MESVRVAFLRGVNMIGRRTLRMEDVARALTGEGVRVHCTVGASGNVVFTAAGDDHAAASRISAALRVHHGLDVLTLVRSAEQLASYLSAADASQLEPDEKLMVTMLDSAPALPLSKVALPEGCRVVHDREDVVISAVRVDARGRSGLLPYLDRRFGKVQTTRAVSTVARVEAAARHAARGD